MKVVAFDVAIVCIVVALCAANDPERPLNVLSLFISTKMCRMCSQFGRNSTGVEY